MNPFKVKRKLLSYNQSSPLGDQNNRVGTYCQFYPTGWVTNRGLGRLGERTAARFLRELGYSILSTNWRCKWGEVDIIANFDKLLILVEVKTRRGLVAEYYPALAAIDLNKQKKLIQLGQIIWDRRGTLFPQQRFKDLRIDAISITFEPFFVFGSRMKVEHLPNFSRH